MKDKAERRDNAKGSQTKQKGGTMLQAVKNERQSRKEGQCYRQSRMKDKAERRDNAKGSQTKQKGGTMLKGSQE